MGRRFEMEREEAGRSQQQRRLSPEKQREPPPQLQSGDLSLSAHFCLRQKRLGRPVELGGDMMLTWDGFLDRDFHERCS